MSTKRYEVSMTLEEIADIIVTHTGADPANARAAAREIVATEAARASLTAASHDKAMADVQNLTP